MTDKDKAGKCGLYCGACPFYLGTKDHSYRERFKKEYGKWEENWYCLGCGNLDEKSWGNDCLISQCAVSKSVTFCHSCSDYPCENLISFSEDDHAHHHTAISGSERMKGIGCNAWLKEQAKRWSCQKCSEPFAWYSKTCSKCGQKVFNSIDEELEKSNSKKCDDK